MSRRGKDLAAIIPIEDLRLLERLSREETDRQDIEAARAALAEPGENISLERIKEEIGIFGPKRMAKRRVRVGTNK